MQNLYLVRRTDEVGFDEFAALIVAADNEQHAKAILPDGAIHPQSSLYNSVNDHYWVSSVLSVRPIGIAVDCKPNEILLQDFRAA